MTDPRFDVVIAGGGVAGSATALALLGAGVGRVAIAEPDDFSTPRIGETVPPDINRFLDAIGARSALQASNAIPSHGSRSLWGGAQPGSNDHLFSAFGPGWHLDRAAFDRAMLGLARQRGATVFQGFTIGRARAGQVCISERETGQTRTLRAGMLVDATGRRAAVAAQFGAKRVFADRLMVSHVMFDTCRDSGAARPSGTTLLQAVEHGWWYGAHIPGGKIVAAFATIPTVAKSLGTTRLAPFLAQLCQADLLTPALAHARLLPDCFAVTAAHSYCLDHSAGPGWIAVGDAASGYDPLSSAGICKALITARSAARVIAGPKSDAAAAQYSARVRHDFEAYTKIKADLYRQVQHWPDAAFWVS